LAEFCFAALKRSTLKTTERAKGREREDQERLAGIADFWLLIPDEYRQCRHRHASSLHPQAQIPAMPKFQPS
jgi:hypothetical protein